MAIRVVTSAQGVVVGGGVVVHTGAVVVVGGVVVQTGVVGVGRGTVPQVVVVHKYVVYSFGSTLTPMKDSIWAALQKVTRKTKQGKSTASGYKLASRYWGTVVCVKYH